MIRLCGVVEIDIFCAPNRNFPSTIPALTTSFRNTCGPIYPWRNIHVSLKNTALRYVVSYFLGKYPYENFSQFMLWGVHRVMLQLWKKPSPI
jgi:hypothetical protein